jgi:thioredoxin 1
MSKPINANSENFEQEVLKSELPVLVDFWAPWCTPCQMMAPVLEELATSMADKVKIVKVDTEEPGNQELAWRYQIMSIPNMKLFVDGKVVKEFIGFRPKEMLTDELNQSLAI